MGSYSARSDEGQRMPYSGWLLARFVEFTKLRSSLRDEYDELDIKPRTLERYLAGEYVAQPDVAQVVRERVAAELLPDFNLDAEVWPDAQLPARALAVHILESASAAWDQLAGAVNSNTYPAFAPRDLLLAVGRFVVIDVALRWGAWAAAYEMFGKSGSIDSGLLSGSAFSALLDAQRDGRTWDALADDLEVSPQAFHDWRAVRSSPKGSTIEDIALQLGPEAEVPNRLFQAQLHRAVGADRLVRDLRFEMSEDLANDYVSATAVFAERFRDMFLETARTSGYGADFQFAFGDVVGNGILSPVSAALLREFMPEVGNHALQRDVHHVTNGIPIVAAVTSWMMLLGDSTRRVQSGELAAEDELRGILRIMTLSNFAEELELVENADPDDPKPLSDYAVWIRHVDPGLAETLLRRAIKMVPTEPVHHFRLGSLLGRYTCGESARVEEGLFELHLAVQLDPTVGNFRNEIGIVLANACRHEAARKAFEAAEKSYSHHAYHWYCRGANSIALGDFEVAVQELERSVACTSQEQEQVRAMKLLACACQKLGKTRSAKKWARRVRHFRREDPLARVDEIIDALFTARVH